MTVARPRAPEGVSALNRLTTSQNAATRLIPRQERAEPGGHTRLALREQAVQGCESLERLVGLLHTRYNVVQSPACLHALLAQTLRDETILAHINDEHLLAGLPR